MFYEKTWPLDDPGELIRYWLRCDLQEPEVPGARFELRHESDSDSRLCSVQLGPETVRAAVDPRLILDWIDHDKRRAQVATVLDNVDWRNEYKIDTRVDGVRVVARQIGRGGRAEVLLLVDGCAPGQIRESRDEGNYQLFLRD
jgi:hypothetical protein